MAARQHLRSRQKSGCGFTWILTRKSVAESYGIETTDTEALAITLGPASGSAESMLII